MIGPLHHTLGAEQPFCIVAFIGSFITERQSMRWTTMQSSAVLRFYRSPCSCDGCQEYVDDMEGRGHAPPIGGIEVQP